MRSGARRNGQSDPHMHRSGVNASSSACTYGQESSQGYRCRGALHQPEIFTKYRPVDARSSSAAKARLIEPGGRDRVARNGRSAPAPRTVPASGPSRPVGRRRPARRRTCPARPGRCSSGAVSRKWSTPSSAACMVVPTMPRPREPLQFGAADVVVDHRDALEPAVSPVEEIQQATVVGVVARVRADDQRVSRAVGVEQVGQLVAPCPARSRPGDTRRRGAYGSVRDREGGCDNRSWVRRRSSRWQCPAAQPWKQRSFDTFRRVRSVRPGVVARCTPERPPFRAGSAIPLNGSARCRPCASDDRAATLGYEIRVL